VPTPTPVCGEDALAVRDIPEGERPKLPETLPSLPLFVDSPGYVTAVEGQEIRTTVDFPETVTAEGIGQNGVTAALRVNASVHVPLLCVTDGFDVAWGDLSLPGRIG